MFDALIRRYSKRKIILLTGDLISLFVVIIVSLTFIYNQNRIQIVNPFGNQEKLLLYISIIFLTIISFRYLNLYKERNYYSGSKNLILVFKSILAASVILIVITFFFKDREFQDNSRFSLLLFFILGNIFVFGYRYTFLKIFRGSSTVEIFKRRIITIGAGDAGRNFAKEIKTAAGHLNLIGFIDDDDNKQGMEIEGFRVLGKLSDLLKIVDSNAIDEIFITIKSITYENLMTIIEKTKETKCQINLVSPYFGVVERRFDSQEYKDFKSVPIYSNITTVYPNYIKRILDLVLSIIILIIISPFLLIISLIIGLTSRGPVFYKTKVIGKNGKEFIWYKFRTMIFNRSDETHKKYLTEIIKNNKPIKKIENDSRITLFGKFLRKYSLDEFPQLLNVVKGDMSLVGPR
ncbi:MAG: hypothetical protein FJ216_11690, partial [Ignavibacteria bacterium]|nr:hypothetical protein [Ignavibacteria bacterium]